MDRDREQVRQEIEETKEAMAAKLGEITERVDSARERVQNARAMVSLRRQVEQRPWAVMGASVVAGIVLYRLGHSWRRRHAPPLGREDIKDLAEAAAEYIGEAAKSAVSLVRDAARAAVDKLQDVKDDLKEKIEHDIDIDVDVETGARKESFIRSAGAGLLDTLVRAAVAGVARTVVTSVVDRVTQPDMRGVTDEGEQSLGAEASTSYTTQSPFSTGREPIRS